MDIPRNLISDSALVQEAFELLRENGGQMTFTAIVDSVFRLSHVDKELAASLVGDLVGNDPRFSIDNEQLLASNDESELRPLKEIDFVVLDVEALASKSVPARIIELGAYRVHANQIGDKFETLINPGLPLPRFIAALTGISDEMLKNAARFSEILDAWLDFAGDAILVAHNSTFDLPLLNREIARVFPGYRMRNGELCTVNLARRVLPELHSHNLDSLAEHFGIENTQRHRAAGDAFATSRILLRLLDQLAESGVRTLSEARGYQSS
ncbi:MAG TPA: exonuclease domain-containing protein [Pyrinomonadaceae bacterium]|nr:exonuclease domain-containing protein [Pyrinomonadaceae bacterium]